MSQIFNFCCKDNKDKIKMESDTDVVDKVGEIEKNIKKKVEGNLENSHMNGNGCPFKSDLVPEKQKQIKPNLKLKVPQPTKLINYLEHDISHDNLHSQENVTSYNTKCTDKLCMSSTMDIPHSGDVRSVEEIYTEAKHFLHEYYASIRRENSDAHIARLKEVEMELKETGTYQLKTSELVCGAKLSWRNATRCIGRIQWKKLQVFDCQAVTTASGMFEALCNHIKYATNKGNIRSAVTIFRQRIAGKNDHRIWNPQLISYAGYLEPDGIILGDPSKVEFTEFCLKLGWKPPRTAWDILPLVLSADGEEPEFFDIPREIVMEVHFEHPTYEWFKELGLRWYALPAVSNMRMDCGGLIFTGTAFNGWYMGTEVGCRDLCDANRLNIIEMVAIKMGLDTNSFVSLWKDRALVEVNIAVLHSFHRDNVSIVDHHSASEQFIKHLDNENKTRGGCPADWIWIVPPMSSSLTSVFHQEMALYHIKPSYDYQEQLWKNYQWAKPDVGKPRQRRFHFKQIARAVRFTSKLFSQALSKRIKATILYATETGKSEQYARELGTVFGHVFNAQVHCMVDYDVFSIEHETLLLIVTSTFGNGEPPANGVEFANHLFKMLNDNKYQDDRTPGIQKLPTPKTLMRTNSFMVPSIEYKRQLSRMESNKYNNNNADFKRQLSRLESNKSSVLSTSSVENLGPLSNVCYSVFGLGSSAYPKYCNFAKTMDRVLEELGGERLLEVQCGDEMFGQEQQFRTWSSNIFRVACETFCLEENEMVKDAKKEFTKMPLAEETIRFGRADSSKPIKAALEAGFKKQLITCKVKENKNLGDVTADRQSIFIDFEANNNLVYEPGDHVGVMPCTGKKIVDAVLSKLKGVESYDKTVQLQAMKETLTLTGAIKTWEPHERIPAVTVRELFTRFVDITTPPSTKILKYLATACTDKNEADYLKELIEDSNKYDDWRHFYYPHLGEVFAQVPSCRPQASLLAAMLPPLQPRFYSISSTPLEDQRRIQLTVSVVAYKTQNGEGSTHYGVCSTYLQNLKRAQEVFIFIRRAPSFYMPKDISVPLILVGPGSGIAPFRGFWRHRRIQIQQLGTKSGPIYLFFGCRTKGMDLYKEEKEEYLKNGTLTKTLLALSREDSGSKKHVQDLLEDEGETISQMLLAQGGHFYVCGDCKMAEEVQHKLKEIIRKHAKYSNEEVEDFLLLLMDENRYHEDIFGITLRTSIVHKASRETAKRTRLESGQSLS